MRLYTLQHLEGSLGVLGSVATNTRQQSLLSACVADLPDDCSISDQWMYYSYDAVLMFAHALHELQQTSNATAPFRIEQISDSLRRQTFVGVSGNITLSKNGDRTSGHIQVMNYAHGRLHIVKHDVFRAGSADTLQIASHGSTCESGLVTRAMFEPFYDANITLSAALFATPGGNLTTTPPSDQLTVCKPGLYLDAAEGCRLCLPG
jgi:hypothetical protein